jgi:Spy/CpxP family protein refolding chaperone
MKPYRLALVTLCAWLPSAFAQHSGATHHEHGAATPAMHAHGPYAGMQGRSIKALSEQQLSDLRAGKGISLALPAELNGYPGPSHALELAEPLKLTAEQKSRTQSLFVQMQQEAKAAGEDVIAAEAALDALFKTKAATPGALRTATHNAAVAQGQLRETHLRYHLAMVELLSPEQVAAYNQLRGY